MFERFDPILVLVARLGCYGAVCSRTRPGYSCTFFEICKTGSTATATAATTTTATTATATATDWTVIGFVCVYFEGLIVFFLFWVGFVLCSGFEDAAMNGKRPLQESQDVNYEGAVSKKLCDDKQVLERRAGKSVEMGVGVGIGMEVDTDTDDNDEKEKHQKKDGSGFLGMSVSQQQECIRRVLRDPGFVEFVESVQLFWQERILG
jgi:hypothetical protein